MRRRIVPLVFVVTIIAVFVAAVVPGGQVSAQAKGRPLIETITVDGPIEPAVAIYVHRAVQQAQGDGAQALVILLDTPGGLDDSMRSIVKDFLASSVPIVVYVWPQGARAASAGGVITIAAHIAAMSPGTNIGAAHPVGLGGGQPDQTMSKKMENDAAAFVRSIAAQRHRNIQWAEQMVRSSVSASETEAKNLGVIDIIAKDQADLFRQINGRKVETNTGTVTINANNPEVRQISTSARERFLHVVGNPNVAYILMLIAIYGIIFELSNPGAILPGVAGGIALILALFSFAVLPVNLAGILLIVFAVALLLIDVFAPTHGILTAGGIIAFVVGSLILFQTQTPAFRVSMTLVITMAFLTAAFFLFAVGSGIRAQRKKVITGKEGMIGEMAEARTDIDPRGKIFAEGTLWNAVTDGEPIKKGETVRIVSMNKLLVKVKKEA